MTKNKDEFDHNNDELTKWDFILANMFVILLLTGLLIAGIVLFGISK